MSAVTAPDHRPAPHPLDPAIDTVLVAAAARVRAVSGPRIADLVLAALRRTLTDTLTTADDGTAFVITGDIPAMWLRDSTTQLTPYLRFVADCPPLADLVAAVVRRQMACLDHDPYANAFNDGPTGAHYDPDDVCDDPHVWEQKYEVDSLAYPVTLAHRLWRETGRTDHLDHRTHRVLATVVHQLRVEQHHDDSAYRFARAGAKPTETLARDGRGTPVAVTGMTWSGFRPSDDACTYGYNIPANLFAAQALLAVADLARDVYADTDLAADARALSRELVEAVHAHGTVPSTDGGHPIYAYEVDGLGHTLCMDDANTPSLLSLPLIAPDVLDHDIWRTTRRFVLSPANPYYFSGSHAAGIGSPHTRPGRIWPIALAVEGLTGSPADRVRLLRLIADTDGGTGRVHESFDPSDPTVFSRPWFSWADSMFCELALTVADDARPHPTGETPMSTKTAVSTPHAPAPAHTFHQGVRTGPFVQVSGQGPVDPATGEYLYPGDVAAQTTRTLENVRAIVEASGARFDDVVMLRVYLTTRDDFAAMNDAYGAFVQEHCPSGVLPSRTTVMVELPREEMLVEIDAFAITD